MKRGEWCVEVGKFWSGNEEIVSKSVGMLFGSWDLYPELG